MVRNNMKQNHNRIISRKEVEHIAWLARIELTETEVNIFTEQFKKILEYFTIIDEADTQGIMPTYQVLDLVNVYREDEVDKSLQKDSPLINAPKKKDGFFKSPRIF